ncbi:MAG: hypothetical protein F6J98_29765 [Moorea sp. SIO4G2]|nr:hypothetical protein [Moorena sp. SIO4G2]
MITIATIAICSISLLPAPYSLLPTPYSLTTLLQIFSKYVIIKYFLCYNEIAPDVKRNVKREEPA